MKYQNKNNKKIAELIDVEDKSNPIETIFVYVLKYESGETSRWESTIFRQHWQEVKNDTLMDNSR